MTAAIIAACVFVAGLLTYVVWRLPEWVDTNAKTRQRVWAERAGRQARAKGLVLVVEDEGDET